MPSYRSASAPPRPDCYGDLSPSPTPHLSYCHGLSIPLYTNPPPSLPYTLRICIHPDWRQLPDGVIHLSGDSVTLSRTSLHVPPLAHVGYQPVDLWRDHVCRTTDVWPPPLPDGGDAAPDEPWPRADAEFCSGRLDAVPMPIPTSISAPASTGIPVSDPTPVRSPAPIKTLGTYTCLAAIVLFIGILQALNPLGHLAWVSTTSINKTADFHIWQPVHLLFRDYENAILPLITPFEFNDSVPIPRKPSSIIAAFDDETSKIEVGLAIWEEVGLPGLDQSLTQRLDICRVELNSLQDTVKDFTYFADVFIRGTSPRILANCLDWAESPRRAAEHMKVFWNLTEERNGKADISARRIQRSLGIIKTELEPLLDIIEELVTPLADEGDWVADLLDAITFIRDYFSLHILHTIPNLVERAVATLSTADTIIAEQLEFWETMESTAGVKDEEICRFTTDEPRWYSSWKVQYEHVATYYSLDNRTVAELDKVADKGDQLKMLLTAEEPRWQYANIRPKRPSER